MKTPPATTQERRDSYGPRPIGALMPALTRPAYRRHAPATAQLLLEWDVIVGPEIAAIALPRRLSGDQLTLACAAPDALELQHRAETLMARINGHFGSILVRRLRFAPATPAIAAPPPPARPALSQHAEQDLAARLESLPPGGLRDALAALGRAVLAARPTPPGKS